MAAPEEGASDAPEMEVDENSSSSDSASGENDEDLNLEAAERRKLEEIEQMVLDDPRSSLELHALLMKGYRQLGDIEKCREARERVVKHYGIGPDLWLEWIEDERCIATSQEEKEALCKLYERAVKEYLSVDLWLSYVQFCIGFLGDEDGFMPVRDIFERALAAAGLHVRSGALIWDAYREFELVILTTLEDCDASEQNQEMLDAQRKRVDSLFRRQLTVPLEFMSQTYNEYVKWKETASGGNIDIDENVKRTYEAACEKLRSVAEYERNIIMDITIDCYDKFKFRVIPGNDGAFYEYLEYETEPARKICLFERAIAELCWSDTIWLKYISYLDENIKCGKTILPVCERAVRNCGIKAKLWVKYLQKLEKYDEPRSVVTAVVEQSFLSPSLSTGDYRSVWLAFLEYLRRQVKWGELEEVNQVEELRIAYNKACEHLAQWFGLDGDPECLLLQSWARMEAIHANDKGAMRRLWNDILSQGHEKSADMWLEYINLEKCYGDTKHLRKLFSRALAATVDYPEKIGDAWLTFERDEGTLDTFEHSEKTVEERLIKHENQPQWIPGASKRWHEPEKTSRWGALGGKSVIVKKSRKNDTAEGGAGTSGENSERQDKHSETVHGITIQHDSSKDDQTVFISNLEYTVNEDTIREKFSSVGTITDLRLVKDFKGRSKGYCYVEFGNSTDAQAALKKDREPLGNRPMFVSKCDPDKISRQPAFKYSTNLEKNKLFVKGLSLTTSKKDLQEIFGAFGDLKDIRIVTYRNGHSKGLAYVEFKNEAAASQALVKTDGMKIHDHVISVAISKPPERKLTSAPSGVKSLGGGPKERGIRGRGRTQLFMPRVLQIPSVSETTASSSASKSSTSTQEAKQESSSKTNSDFRQMLLGKK